MKKQSSQQMARWAFEPTKDTFSPQALLDLRYLNEKVAGESGFVKVNSEGDFILGNGKPVRFWAVNTNVGREKPWVARPQWGLIAKEPDLAFHAKFLAKRGVNMVRCHASIQPAPDQPITAFNTKERDWIWRTVAAMKQQGIYTTISPYFALTAKIGKGWGVAGNPDDAHALLFFDETMQTGYKAWMKALFAEKNAYTGIPLAKDPSVAIISLQNEDSLLFWTVNNLKGEQKLNIQRKFANWCVKKYKTINNAISAWENNTLPEDNLSQNRLTLHNLWELTQNRAGGMHKRLSDQAQFFGETMMAFNTEMIAYLRSLGCQQVINPGNWKTADNARLGDIERWSYTAGDVLSTNHYFGGVHVGDNAGWAVAKGDQFTSISALKTPDKIPTNLKQTKGKAMLITESGWVMPNGYTVEGPFLIAAYQSLLGVDAFYWFATSEEDWTPPMSANGYMGDSVQKWPIATPDTFGNFPAAALLYRKGYLQRGKPVLVEERSMDDLWQRRTPTLAEESSYDPNRDKGNLAPTSSFSGVLPQEAFLVGPVQVVYGSDAKRTKVEDVAPYIDRAKKTVQSNTKEIRLNWDKGLCIINAPKAQGVCGFLSQITTPLALTDTTFQSTNPHGAIYVVSLDDKPLRTSQKVLVQIGMGAEPTGWQAKPTQISISEGKFDGFQIESVGHAPWAVARASGMITLKNALLKTATVLDANGMPTQKIPLTRAGTEVSLTLPASSLYVVLE
jgi:hypothetical protein